MNSELRSSISVLVVGESWIKHTVHLKGFDQFHTTEYEEGAGVFLAALENAGFEVTYIRAHEVSRRFPVTREDLDSFDVVILSDIGSNSFLLCDETFLRSERTTNRLVLLADYVDRWGWSAYGRWLHVLFGHRRAGALSGQPTGVGFACHHAGPG